MRRSKRIAQREEKEVKESENLFKSLADCSSDNDGNDDDDVVFAAPKRKKTKLSKSKKGKQKQIENLVKNLPDEVIHLIFSFFQVPSQFFNGILPNVCKDWYMIIHHDYPYGSMIKHLLFVPLREYYPRVNMFGYPLFGKSEDKTKEYLSCVDLKNLFSNYKEKDSLSRITLDNYSKTFNSNVIKALLKYSSLSSTTITLEIWSSDISKADHSHIANALKSNQKALKKRNIKFVLRLVAKKIGSKDIIKRIYNTETVEKIIFQGVSHNLIKRATNDNNKTVEKYAKESVDWNVDERDNQTQYKVEDIEVFEVDKSKYGFDKLYFLNNDMIITDYRALYRCFYEKRNMFMDFILDASHMNPMINFLIGNDRNGKLGCIIGQSIRSIKSETKKMKQFKEYISFCGNRFSVYRKIISSFFEEIHTIKFIKDCDNLFSLFLDEDVQYMKLHNKKTSPANVDLATSLLECVHLNTFRLVGPSTLFNADGEDKFVYKENEHITFESYAKSRLRESLHYEIEYFNIIDRIREVFQIAQKPTHFLSSFETNMFIYGVNKYMNEEEVINELYKLFRSRDLLCSLDVDRFDNVFNQLNQESVYSKRENGEIDSDIYYELIFRNGFQREETGTIHITLESQKLEFKIDGEGAKFIKFIEKMFTRYEDVLWRELKEEKKYKDSTREKRIEEFKTNLNESIPSEKDANSLRKAFEEEKIFADETRREHLGHAVIEDDDLDVYFEVEKTSDYHWYYTKLAMILAKFIVFKEATREKALVNEIEKRGISLDKIKSIPLIVSLREDIADSTKMNLYLLEETLEKLKKNYITSQIDVDDSDDFSSSGSGESCIIL